jgi:hypothetical protein
MLKLNADLPEETLTVHAEGWLLARITDVPLQPKGVDPADRAPRAPERATTVQA